MYYKILAYWEFSSIIKGVYVLSQSWGAVEPCLMSVAAPYCDAESAWGHDWGPRWQCPNKGSEWRTRRKGLRDVLLANALSLTASNEWKIPCNRNFCVEEKICVCNKVFIFFRKSSASCSISMTVLWELTILSVLQENLSKKDGSLSFLQEMAFIWTDTYSLYV